MSWYILLVGHNTPFYRSSEVLASILPPDIDKEEYIENLVSSRTTKWIRYFYRYNPADEIRKITIPAFVLHGSKDTQVPPKHHLQPIRDALSASRSSSFEVVLLEGLNHLFQESNTGHISEYPLIEQTFAPSALDRITTWILKQTR